MKGSLCLAVVVLLAAGVLSRSGDARAAPTRARALPQAVADGGKIFQKWCAECHNDRGFGTVVLQRRYQGSVPAILDQRTDLNGEVVDYAVRHGVSFMPSFRKTEIDDQELAALSAYLISGPKSRARGN